MNSNKVLNIEMSKSRSPSGAKPASDDSDKMVNIKTINLLESSTEQSMNQSAQTIQVYNKTKDYTAYFRAINGAKIGSLKKAGSGSLRAKPSSTTSQHRKESQLHEKLF